MQKAKPKKTTAALLFKFNSYTDGVITMKPLQFNNWHAWAGTAGILLSNETTKHLQQFKTIDDVINWLFLNGERDAARYFNGEKTKC